jgi:hypothetical protein
MANNRYYYFLYLILFFQFLEKLNNNIIYIMKLLQ